jgi:hypothetical protein
MRGWLLVLVPVVAALAFSGCGGNGEGAQENGAAQMGDDRDCGVTEVDGTQARVFCGEADASVTVAGSEHSFSAGECEVGDAWVVVNIGTLLLGDPTRMAEHDYFGLYAGDHPDAEPDAEPAPAAGAYEGGSVTFSAGGTGYLIVGTPSWTFAEDRTRGEFTAVTSDGDEVTGSFTC